MARPKKICPDCGKSMAGNHYWYKGGWRCKKSNRKVDGDDKPTETSNKVEDKKKAPPKKDNKPKERDDGSVKGYEREAGEDQDSDVKVADSEAKKSKKKKVGQTISAAEIREIDAETESEARSFINSVFPNASSEEKTRALRVWKARQK